MSASTYDDVIILLYKYLLVRTCPSGAYTEGSLESTQPLVLGGMYMRVRVTRCWGKGQGLGLGLGLRLGLGLWLGLWLGVGIRLLGLVKVG